ncbi:MAG: 4-phosphoerythronate dehydrogenase [Thiomicrospira sp.]|uniref:4-phosphoerythronate dehydrogenase n=1 Tax=Thiomicrospira sp. TaxID=935 RepID=UPI0019FF3EE3|nr:4-phosphoerythronate dehydrogenase [Thiomicrospira sp.]MBE0493690.1 4-phosphoerythronate dehydrogenase [Thiomicrospira sp.]
MTQKTLIIDDAIPYAQAMFAHLGDVKLVPGRDIDANLVKQADALIVRSRTQVNADLLQNSRVEFVGSTVVGLDHIDQAWLSQRGIRFYSAQGCNANSVAEYVISALLVLAEQHQIDLSQQTLGIIGVGHVGQLLQQKARALGIRCLLNDPPRQQTEGDAAFTELNDLLQQADIISVHTPLTKSGEFTSLDLLSAHNMALIKPSAIVINAARGGIINEQAWCQLNNRANVIDCWQNEPNINADLYAKADIATAHIAGHSLEAKVAGSAMVYQQLCEFWKIAPQTDWQRQLPPAPLALTAPSDSNPQTALAHILKQAYDIVADDHAIRSKSVKNVQNQFELHRRQYPIRREWCQHQLPPSHQKKLDKTLKALGFQLISAQISNR